MKVEKLIGSALCVMSIVMILLLVPKVDIGVVFEATIVVIIAAAGGYFLTMEDGK